MPLFGYPTCPPDKEDMIRCPYLYCLAGTGLVGSGRCFLCGCWWSNSCGAFIDEDRWIKKETELWEGAPVSADTG